MPISLSERLASASWRAVQGTLQLRVGRQDVAQRLDADACGLPATRRAQGLLLAVARALRPPQDGLGGLLVGHSVPPPRRPCGPLLMGEGSRWVYL